MVEPYKSALPLISTGIACAIGCNTSPPAFRVASLASFGNSGMFARRSARTFLAPRVVSFFPAVVIGEQLFFVLGEVVIHVLRNEVMFVWQAERLARGI